MAEDGRDHAAAKHALAIEVLRSHGLLRIKAFGTSMIPTIWPGDVLTITAVDSENLQAGDVVMLSHRGMFVVHRLSGIRRMSGHAYLDTRGDSVPHSDPLMTEAQLLGKVLWVERDGRRFAPARRPSVGSRVLGRLVSRSTLLLGLVLHLRSLVSVAGPGVLDIRENQA